MGRCDPSKVLLYQLTILSTLTYFDFTSLSLHFTSLSLIFTSLCPSYTALQGTDSWMIQIHNSMPYCGDTLWVYCTSSPNELKLNIACLLKVTRKVEPRHLLIEPLPLLIRLPWTLLTLQVSRKWNRHRELARALPHLSLDSVMENPSIHSDRVSLSYMQRWDLSHQNSTAIYDTIGLPSLPSISWSGSRVVKLHDHYYKHLWLWTLDTSVAVAYTRQDVSNPAIECVRVGNEQGWRLGSFSQLATFLRQHFMPKALKDVSAMLSV